MTKEEALKLMAILKAAYPNSYNGMTKQEALGVVTVWALQFAGVPADVVFMALQKAISANRFPPSVNEVKQKLNAVHWEAYEALNDNPFLTEKERRAYERIYRASDECRYAKSFEPKISEMLSAGPFQPALGEGAALPRR